MKILIADGNKLNEKFINESNPKISFEYYDYLDFLSFEYNNNFITLKKNEIYYEILDNKSNELEIYSKVTIKSRIDNNIYKIYILPDYDENYKKYKIKTNTINIGTQGINVNNIYLNNEKQSLEKIIINISEDNLILENSTENNIYINNYININQKINIKYGDTIFFDGVFFTIVGNNIFIYNSNNLVIDKNCYFEEIEANIDLEQYKEIQHINYTNNNTLNLSPTIKKKIISKTFNIDPPSSVELKEANPLILTMMPMVLMSSTSMIMSFNIINNIKQGKTTWQDNSISLVFSGVMIFTMILYPIIQNAYKKHKESKREIKRIEEYKDYIYEKKRKITEEIQEQKNVLINNFKDSTACIDLLNNNIEQIWDKKINDEDFLMVSLGTGKIRPNIEIRYPEEHFTIDRDKLRIQITKLKEQVEFIEDCPVLLNLYKNNNISFVGKNDLLYKYIKSLLLKLFCSHSFNDVKFCVFSNSKNKAFWEQYYNLPYFWDQDYSVRFFGYSSSSISNIVNYLDNIYKERKIRLENSELEKTDTNYVIIVDNYKAINEIVFLKEILSVEKNYGFTILFLTENMSDLPAYCKNFIKLNNTKEGKIIIKDNNYKEQDFIPDINESDYSKVYIKLASYCDRTQKHKSLPDKITFLEMYKVDGVDKLNIIDRWQNNTTLDDISVPIGMNEYGDLLNLDLHETAHGPHGLIAGMTGSGKSELIITFILSLCINYSPEDVQFVLIDYKGGGLSNTFYSNELGKRLPHITGVITNISESEINRCLISLQSEIKRRQVLFGEVSLKYNEGNIDIYKYQQLAKKHKDVEYLSHLIIISDEFAELKTQNPEFIEKLISLARIGRSLGIHLILSTQKPSGVVDSQIWSNSKFKICLKVQEKSDSKEVIGVDDAVSLNNPGRFYLQIGYNELFLKGQSAYANAPYYIEETDSKMSNYKLDFINEYGKVYYTYNTFTPNTETITGTHVSNVVKHLITTAINQNYNFKYLWKDSLEEKIFIDQLLKKYNYQKNPNIEIVFGEYDEIDKQRKDLANYTLTDGNIILYGLTGSGKSELIETSVYFLLKYYLASEINIYILDFSLENSKIFLTAPQVGDVMYLYEKEKIINTFKYLNAILSERRDLLANYGGSIEKYNQQTNNKLPIIFVIISNLERLFENFNELENSFIDLTRDCNKYGISIMTTLSSVNGVRSKLVQNFKQILTLELKDKYDYDSLFGSKIKYSLANIHGRGYIKKEKVYEMQSARILDEEENSIDYIENFCNSLNSDIKAPPIPTLPDTVSYDLILPYLKNNLIVPIGIDIETLEILNFDFSKNNGTIITGNDNEILDNYTKSLLKNFSVFKKNKVYIFSDENVNIENVTCINKEYEKYITQLMSFIDNSDLNYNYYMIFKSLNNILESLDIKQKAIFYDVIDKINDKNNFHLILIDMVLSIKKYEYSEFYINNFNRNRGIFVGEGIMEQYIIKTNLIPRKFRELPGPNFGYYIENSKVKCIKLLEYKNE